MNSILIRNCSCLDPLHGTQFESKDLLIKDGFFRPKVDGNSENTREIDANGRVVVPGGILPSFKLPAGLTFESSLDLAASARALVETGFTTVVIDGITPFTALDAHQRIQRLPVVNKVPIIDFANFQFFTGFLKNGVSNYAAAVAASILRKMKGHGISAIGPGSTLEWSKSTEPGTRTMSAPIPFLGMNIEKLVIELVGIHDHGFFKPGMLLETGIEGFPASRAQLDGLLARITGAIKSGGNEPLVAIKQLARYALDPDYKGGEIAENVPVAEAAMAAADNIAGLVDLPSMDFTRTTYIDNAASPLHDSKGILSRGIIEGELFVITYSISEKEKLDLAARFWLAGMKFALDMPAPLKERVAFSLMPQLINSNSSIAGNMGCLLSERYRLSKRMVFPDASSKSRAAELLKGKEMTFPELVNFTRAVPAKIFGLDKLLGGFGDGQIGDVIILNARPGDLDRLRDEPDHLHDLLTNPFAVIKGGMVALENGHFNPVIRGYTMLHEVQGDSTIADSIEQNLDKQFLKYYSTHLDGKIVPASLVEPAITD
ncbi:MAG: hypothetical protein Q6373_012680 [Candidatus Sigynarchaeota archaeon]